VVLRYQGGQVFGLDSLFRHVEDYERLALSVPWLTSYLAVHPQKRVMLRYVHESSLNQRAMSIFSADMRAADEGDLAAEVSAVWDKVALLVAGHDDYWLVLPDRRMILWRFSGVNGLLKFRPTDFARHECTDDRGVTGGCVGAVVTPEGVLVK
jgi:hypothetical protein